MLEYSKNGISVDVTLIPRKNKTHKEKYCIYIGFVISTQGIKEYNYEISSGINIAITQWQDSKAIGKDYDSKLINDRIDNFKSRAKEMLNDIIPFNLKQQPKFTTK